MSRTKNAFRNIIWAMIEKFAHLFSPFITRTLLIHILGAEYLGLNSLFTSVLQVLNVANLGFGTAIVFSMYKPIAEKDNDTLCALLNMYRKIYRYVGSIILVCGLAILPILPNLIKGDVPSDVNIYVIYFVCLFDTVVGYFLYSYRASLFTAHQRNDLASKRSSIIQILSCILQCSMLILFNNYYLYLFVLPVATICTNIINAYLSKKIYPQIVCRGTISKEMKQDIKKRVMGLISYKIYSVVFNSVDTIVISSFLGLVPLAIFNNYYYVQTAVIGIVSIFIYSLTASVGNKMITNSRDDNYRDFLSIVFVNGWIASWCAVCLLCLYQHFMAVWVGEEYLFPFGTMILMVLYFILPRITSVTYMYREAAGLWWEDRLRPLAATVVNLAVNIISVRIIGMNGVILSTIVCSVFINIPWGTIILFKNYFKRSPIEYFSKIFYYLLVTAVSCTATYAVCSLLSDTGILNMFFKAGICVIIPNIIFLLFYFKLDEFDYMKNFLCRFIRK